MNFPKHGFIFVRHAGGWYGKTKRYLVPHDCWLIISFGVHFHAISTRIPFKSNVNGDILRSNPKQLTLPQRMRLPSWEGASSRAKLAILSAWIARSHRKTDPLKGLNIRRFGIVDSKLNDVAFRVIPVQMKLASPTPGFGNRLCASASRCSGSARPLQIIYQERVL